MSNLKEKIWALKQDIVTFLIIFLSCSFAVENDIISSTATIALWIFVAFLMLDSKLIIKLASFAPVMILLLFMWISVLINEPSRVFKYLCITFGIIVVWIYTQKYSVDSFVDSFCKVMFYLALLSLLFYLIFISFPQAMNSFIVYGKSGKPYAVLYFYAHKVGSIRNMGMFWEPGAHQTFLNIALMLEIIRKDKRILRILFLSFTIATTFSSTAFIAMAISYFYLIIQIKEIKGWKKSIVLLAVMSIILFFLNADSIISSNSGYSVFGKISDMLNTDKNVVGETSTSSIRYYSIVKPIYVFITNPIIGVGYDNLNYLLYDYTNGMNTCTFINYFALFGVMYGFTCIYGFVGFSKMLSKEKTNRILAFIIILLVSMSENYALLASFYLFCFYGFDRKMINEKQEFIDNEKNCSY